MAIYKVHYYVIFIRYLCTFSEFMLCKVHTIENSKLTIKNEYYADMSLLNNLE